ncbi:MAG: acyltransferase [Oscillospiraceae bacterium]|nr:acyltransferase [Oscillospiraceae bacterium]
MASPRNRNGKIDFLKFLFAALVLVHHSRYVVGDKNSLFLGGSFAVEFYFLVSGYLMMASIKKMSERTVSLGAETGAFLLKKYKSFCPEILITYVIAFAVTYLGQKTKFFTLLSTTFSEILLINMTGIWAKSVNGAIWYLSSMLIAMAFLFPLLRKYGDTALYVIIPVGSVLLLGWFCGNVKSPRNPTEWLGWTYKGNIRALAELGLGITLYPIVEKIKKLNFTVFGRILLTAVEYICYAQLLHYMYTSTATRKDFFYLLVYAIALIISFSQMGIDTVVFRGSFFSWLGKFSFPLYLSHHFYSKNIRAFFPDYSDKRLLVVYYGISVLTALFVMFLSDLIRKHGSKLKLKRLFVRPAAQ